MKEFLTWLLHAPLTLPFWFQPFFYALHGWLATEMALWMLFHPYKPVFIPGTRIQLPLTPGILPRGRDSLFKSISDTVTSTLLTESDIHRQAEKLITEENLVRCIEALLDSIEREMRNTEQIRQIYRYGEEVLPDLLNQLLNGLIDNLEHAPPEKLQAWLPDTISAPLSNWRLDYSQAEFVTDMLFNTLLTPHALRRLLVDGLNDRNIPLIENSIIRRVGGLKGFLVRFAGIDKNLVQLRDYMEEQPEAAEEAITDMLDRLEIRERLAERISNFSYAELPEDTRSALSRYAGMLLRDILVDHKSELSAAIAQGSGRISRMVINRMLQTSPKTWLNEKRPDLKRELARFLHRYLHRELKLMIGAILPAIDVGGMILEKLDQFSNRELEHMIYRLCRRELRWMAFLGAFLGFWLGLVSNLVNYWLQQVK